MNQGIHPGLIIFGLFVVMVISVCTGINKEKTARAMLAIDQWIMDCSGYFVLALGVVFVWVAS